jgi:hypothetical protein
MLKEFIAKILTALAIHPALRGATASQKIGAPLPSLAHRDHFDESEVDIGGGACQRATGENYTGARTNFRYAAWAMAAAKGKRYFNSSLGGARQEFDEFVAKRTVEE